MSARAYVRDDHALRGVQLILSPREGRIVEWREVVETDAAEGVEPNIGAVLHLPDGQARAIYDALARHYGGGADSQTLRRDYDAERKRVDLFIAHLTGGAS